ncbi:MAG: hypothetical protein IKN17_11345 [Ruminococcus sp.]|nr:hypothetical protein [Ruminococcus sp.]
MRPGSIKALIGKVRRPENRIRLIVFMGALAVGLIFLSELLPKGGGKKADTSSEPQQVISSEDYVRQTEQRLSELLSGIRGVGRAELILSAEGSEEYIYAEELDTVTEQTDSETVEKYKNKLFVTERTGNKDGMIRQILNPRFNGALVVCDGGSDPAVRERVIKAVSAALDLPTSKICVESRKN